MELNRKDVLKAAAAATSEFVKQLYCGDGADENEPAVTFETTITLLDKDSTPISVIRSTKTNLEPTENFSAADSEKPAAEEAQSEEQEAKNQHGYRDQHETNPPCCDVPTLPDHGSRRYQLSRNYRLRRRI